jgi:predicted  nucleic acid-binding Zn-ribbon protein
VFEKKLESQINDLDGKIAQLREKGRDLQTAAKANWDQKMAELDVKLDAARAKLAKVVHSEVEVWKDFQKEAETAYDDLDKNFRSASQ